MTISIIIPTFNRCQLLQYTLASVVPNKHKTVRLQVIVVDDGSDDGTKEMVAAKFPWAIYLLNKGRGAAAARNTGLAHATGAYIMYLDSDDLVGENYFAAKVAALSVPDAPDAVYGSYDFFRANGEFDLKDVIFRHKYPVLPGKAHARQHLVEYLSGNFLPPHTLIWRRSLLQQIGGHNEHLSINQDVDLFIRAVLHGAKIAAVTDDTKVYIRDHELDARVGHSGNKQKWVQILELRKTILPQLASAGFNEPQVMEAMSSYLFDKWRQLRHAEPQLATQFLQLARQVYWPVKLKGNPLLGLLAKIIGPHKVVQLKYSILKRD